MTLDILGLIFGIVGTVIIFFFGMPPPIFKAGQYILDEPSTEELGKQLLYVQVSRLGLLLLLLAFVLQVFSVFI